MYTRLWDLRMPAAQRPAADEPLRVSLTKDKKVRERHIKMSHTASRSWISDEVREKENFMKLRDLLGHFVPRSPLIPQTLPEWLTFKVASTVAKVAAMRNRVETREALKSTDQRYIGSTMISKIQPALQLPQDFRSAVLALPTIWVSGAADPYRLQAPWPEYEELKHEGDDRSRSSYGRFLPLPRKPGNITVNWKAREMLQPLRPLDLVGPAIGAKYNDAQPAEELSNRLMQSFAGQSLVAAIDE